jgi:hypothetical protein
MDQYTLSMEKEGCPLILGLNIFSIKINNKINQF